jgi:hypothetical protein
MACSFAIMSKEPNLNVTSIALAILAGGIRFAHLFFLALLKGLRAFLPSMFICVVPPRGEQLLAAYERVWPARTGCRFDRSTPKQSVHRTLFTHLHFAQVVAKATPFQVCDTNSSFVPLQASQA